MESVKKRIISFSLWGDQDRYLIPALINAQRAPEIYSGWEVYFYVADNLDPSLITELENLNCTVIKSGLSQGTSGAMWRFQACAELDADAIIFRDADSMISAREASIVAQWLKSGKVLNVMRDHPWQAFPILAGMWGIRQSGLEYVNQCVQKWFLNPQKMNYFDDQLFLYEQVYKHFQHDMYLHSPFFYYQGETVQSKETEPFPMRNFMGMCYIGGEVKYPRIIDYVERPILLDLPKDGAIPKINYHQVCKDLPIHSFVGYYLRWWSKLKCLLAKKKTH